MADKDRIRIKILEEIKAAYPDGVASFDLQEKYHVTPGASLHTDDMVYEERINGKLYFFWCGK